MAIHPPSQRNWWKEPIARTEIIWIVIAFCWGLLMFSAMVYWHIAGEQNLSNEAYRTTPEAFAAKANEMVEKYQVREEAGMPVVHPPPGSDVYMIARLCSGGRYSSSRRTRPTVCIFPRWTGNTGFPCNRSTSICRFTPITTWS